MAHHAHLPIHRPTAAPGAAPGRIAAHVPYSIPMPLTALPTPIARMSHPIGLPG
jgi:hypothetical protein